MSEGWLSLPTTVVGLDVGTTKICTLVARVLPDSWDVIAFATVPSQGIRQATIVDLQGATEAIKGSVHQIKEKTGIRVKEAWIGITGHHIRSHLVEESLQLRGDETLITEAHIDALMDRAQKKLPLSKDRSLIHALRHQFIIDGVGGVHHPIGMAAHEVKVRVHFITATASFVQNLEVCVRQAGMEVADLILEPLAAGEAVLTESEKVLGTALLDIGGGTTDVAVFRDGILIDTFALPVGGNHVTRDIAIGLRTPLEEAERLKVRYGCALVERAREEEEVEVLELGRGTTRTLPQRTLAEIIEPRMREIFELVRERLVRRGWKEELTGGIVLTGGGSLLEGVVELAEQVLQVPARLGEPVLPPGSPQELRSPIYATVIGLVLWGIHRWRETERYLSPWRRWLRDLFIRLKSRLRF